MSDVAGLTAQIEAQGIKIRDLKVELIYLNMLCVYLILCYFHQSSKASPDAIKAEVNELLALKAKFKETTGLDFVVAPAPPTTKKAKETETCTKKSQQKEAPVVVPEKVDSVNLNELVLYTNNDKLNKQNSLKCFLVAEANNKVVTLKTNVPEGLSLYKATIIFF